MTLEAFGFCSSLARIITYFWLEAINHTSQGGRIQSDSQRDQCQDILFNHTFYQPEFRSCFGSGVLRPQSNSLRGKKKSHMLQYMAVILRFSLFACARWVMDLLFCYQHHCKFCIRLLTEFYATVFQTFSIYPIYFRIFSGSLLCLFCIILGHFSL